MLGPRNLLIIFLTTLILAACGGGGGGGGGGSTPVAPLSITTTNAPMAAGDVVEAADAVEGFGGGSSGSILGVVTTTDDDRQSFVNVIRSQIDKFSLLQGTGSATVTGVVIGPTTVPCTVSGTATISGNVADPLGLTSGDSLGISFNGCDEGDGSLLNGGLNLVITAVTGDPLVLPLDMTIDVTLNNLVFTENGDTVTGNGDLSLSLSTADNITFMTSLSGSSLTISENSVSGALRNYQVNATVNEGTGDYTFDASGTFESADLGGSVVFSTPTSFQGIGSNYPYAGVYLITGQNSAARLTALDDVNVLLEVDENGDGIFETTINTTWVAVTG